MVKLAFRLSVLSLLLWNTFSEPRNCYSIYHYEKVFKLFSCFSMFYQEVPNQLKFRMKRESYSGNSFNLELNNIRFNLSENGSSIMPINWLNISLPNLEWLRLRDIPISDIEEDAFYMGSFSKLKYLEMLNVPLKTLKRATFKGLKRLEILILKGLRLVEIEKKVLAPMANLQIFKIDDCGAEKISLENLFGTCKLPNMYEVYIHNCNLKDTINSKTFRSLRQAQILSLSSNQIEKIGLKSFNFVNKPKIELQSNNLTTISVDLIRSFKEILVNLTENPWHCDCQMEPFRLYLQNQTNMNLDQIICNTPMEFHGMNLKDCPQFCDGMTILDWTNESETSIGDSIKVLTRESKSETEIETEAKTVAETVDLTEIEKEFNRTIESESTKTTTENEPRIETETETKPDTESIDLECNCSDTFKANQIIQLTRHSHNIAPITRKHNGELLINKDATSNDLIIIKFEQFLADEKKTCFKHTKNINTKKINYKRNFKPETLYQFCWMEKMSKTIFPLDCIISSSINLESGVNDSDAWIMEKRKSIVIIVCVLSAVVAPFVGVLIAVILAKLFQKKIRELENVVTISNDQKAIDNKESDYATPLPPRKRVVFREEPNCCSAEYCICYCEI